MPQISESKMKWQNIIGRKDKKGYLCTRLHKGGLVVQRIEQAFPKR